MAGLNGCRSASCYGFRSRRPSMPTTGPLGVIASAWVHLRLRQFQHRREIESRYRSLGCLPTSLNAPLSRRRSYRRWTGSEMIVWGGYDSGNDLNTGGRYNPNTDTWIPTSTANAPTARESHSAVWTGSEMIIWGGVGCGSNCRLNTGGIYNPSTGSWTAMSTVNAPSARWNHNALWTGSEMIIWGGTDQTNYLRTGARYNPRTDTWGPMQVPNATIPGRDSFAAVWSGSEMIVWGGVDETFHGTGTGGRYNPSTDSWIATNIANAPSPRSTRTGVWTGREMIIWAGSNTVTDLNTGGRYNPGTDSWTPTTAMNAPVARDDSHRGVDRYANDRLGWDHARLGIEHWRTILRAALNAVGAERGFPKDARQCRRVRC